MPSTVTRCLSNRVTFGMWYRKLESRVCGQQICSSCFVISVRLKSQRNVSSGILIICHLDLTPYRKTKSSFDPIWDRSCCFTSQHPDQWKITSALSPDDLLKKFFVRMVYVFPDFYLFFKFCFHSAAGIFLDFLFILMIQDFIGFSF